MRIPAIITEQSITVTGPDFVPRAIPRSHPNFERVRTALENDGTWADIKDLVDLPKAITDFTKGRIAVRDGVLFYDNKVVDNLLSKRILDLIADKKERTADPLIKFMENVNLNPSMRAVEGLYEWLEKSNLPITPDGCIIAWKIVRENYRDIHSGKFDNSVGQVVQVARNHVDENPDRTCSYGLHFCSSEYLPHFSHSGGKDRIMVLKIHPKDVVAFPRDYNTAKGRCCKYEVIGEIENREVARDMFAGIQVCRAFGQAGFDPGDTSPEIGAKYLTRGGDTIEIVEDTGHATYPFKADNGASYSVDGEYLVGTETLNDLVERLA